MVKETRAEKAGRKMGHAIAETVNLMYQKNTALNFLWGLTSCLNDHYDKRLNDWNVRRLEQKIRRKR